MNDPVFEALKIRLPPEELTPEEVERLRTVLTSFLLGGGHFCFREWLAMHKLTRNILEEITTSSVGMSDSGTLKEATGEVLEQAVAAMLGGNSE